MRLSEEVRRLLMRAIEFARENRYVYVTPETVLLKSSEGRLRNAAGPLWPWAREILRI